MQTKCTNILFNIIRDDYLFIYGSKIKFFFQNLVWVLKRSEEGYVMNLKSILFLTLTKTLVLQIHNSNRCEK